MKPRVGVSRWEDVPGERIQAYWDRLSEAGLEATDLHEPGADLSGLAGLILTGGIDIDPSRYGEEPHPKVRRTDPDRDAFELQLLAEARERGLPVLAICRGSQLLNVAFGGSLLQHIESGEHVADYRAEGYPSRSHEVRLVEGSRLARIFDRERLIVNSRHHQAVTPERVAKGLRAAALSDDGLVEAVEAESRWVVGVQWHPERLEPDIEGFAEASRLLFAAFAAAIEEHRSG
jgi:putative glutamine amidotransferase